MKVQQFECKLFRLLPALCVPETELTVQVVPQQSHQKRVAVLDRRPLLLPGRQLPRLVAGRCCKAAQQAVID